MLTRQSPSALTVQYISILEAAFSAETWRVNRAENTKTMAQTTPASRFKLIPPVFLRINLIQSFYHTRPKNARIRLRAECGNIVLYSIKEPPNIIQRPFCRRKPITKF